MTTFFPDFDEMLAERDEEIKRLQVELARAHEENTRLKRTNLNGNDTSMTPEDNPVSEQNVWRMLLEYFMPTK